MSMGDGTSSRPRKPLFRRRRLYEDIAGHLEQEIAEGRFRVGDPLPSERELMDRLGVGRTAVREALFALEKMGLVASTSGERARVIRPTAEVLVEQLAGAARQLLREPRGVREFQEARAVFEAGMAGLAAQQAQEADISHLHALLEANRQALADGEAFARTDIAFHVALSEMTRNSIFPALHEAIVVWLTEQRRVSAAIAEARAAAYRWHERIAEAVAAHDPRAAEEAMRRHLEEVAGYYWQARADAGAPPPTLSA